MGSALSAYRGLSLWHETTPTDWTPRPALEDDVEADVAIVGAGFTGLWTAYYLSVAEPSLRVVVLEAEVAGFGASGRNGGWCSALFPASYSSLARMSSPAAADAQYAAMRASVDEVLRVASAEGIDCHAAKGGTIVLARNRAQLLRGAGLGRAAALRRRGRRASARDPNPRRDVHPGLRGHPPGAAGAGAGVEW